MTTTKVTETIWYPEKRLVVTHISGDLDKDDVERWEISFMDALDRIEDNTTFKVFVNMHGFKAMDIEAHKRFRAVVPLTLAGRLEGGLRGPVRGGGPNNDVQEHKGDPMCRSRACTSGRDEDGPVRNAVQQRQGTFLCGSGAGEAMDRGVMSR